MTMKPVKRRSIKNMLLSKKVKSSGVQIVVSFIVTWTLLLMFISKSLGENNLIYAIGEISAYDPNLFIGNVYMGEDVISPRFIIDIVFSIMMHLNGGDWAGAALIWIYFGAIVQAFGIVNIAYRISERYQLVISGLFTCLTAYCNNYLAGFSLIYLESISMGVALAFSFLSISFLIGKKRNYNMAWTSAAFATICHVHEGLYCCAVIILFMVVDSIIQKRVLWRENWAVVIAIVASIAVVVPSILTDSMNISNAEFVYIYSVFRHPHHLVPSTWGIDTIYKTIWIDICLLILSVAGIAKATSEKMRFFVYEAVALILAWIAAVCLMYVFTEVKPVAFISTLFLSKSFKYVLLVALIWNVKSAFDLRDHGDYISSYLFVFFAFLASSYELEQIGFITVIIFTIMIAEDYFISIKNPFIPIKALPVTDLFFFLFMICVRQGTLGLKIGSLLNLIISFKSGIATAMNSGMEQGLTIILVFIAIVVVGYAMKRKFRGYKLLCVAACICMFGLSLFGRIVLYDSGSISIINGEKALRFSMGNDLYELAKKFKDQTDVTTEFLADPDDTVGSGWFQIVSQRNCYVVNKVVPSSKSTVQDWYNRYLQTTSFDQKSDEELKEIMDSAGLEYILINTDNYLKFDESDVFTVIMSSPGDSYRIYELN